MTQDALLLVILALPFAGSLVAAFLPANARNAEAWLAGAIALAVHGIAWTFYPAMSKGIVARIGAPWLPSFGLDFMVRMDGFAWLFVTLVSGIGFLVMLYARYYMPPSDPVPRFFSFLLAFMGSMLGALLSGNLVQLVFFWELTSLFSFLLIGYWHHSAAARDGARMALIVTSAGGLALFAGVLVIGHIAGGYDLDTVLAAGDRIRAHPLYLTALLLVLAGTFTKSAQFPFHFWLPQAMAAPTPVSAFLHSAAMVKLGVFLMTRLWPVLSGTDEWMWTVGLAGLVTLVLGAFLAIFQNDLKGLLAYSTISHLGLITVLLGLNSPLATVAAVFHILNHATFKASLFMAAGAIDHEAGTRDIRRLNGLYRYMPITATAATVAAAAMAGVPLLNGFLSKEMFFAESLRVSGPVEALDRALPYIATLWGIFSVAYSLRLIHGVFFGPAPVGLPRTPHEPPRWMRFPIELLVLACLAVGIFPALTVGPLLEVAVPAILGAQTPQYSLAVWHGFTRPLAMSLVAMAGGAICYALLHKRLGGDDRKSFVEVFDTRRAFDTLLIVSTRRWPAALLRVLGTERLQPQLRWALAAAVVATLWPVSRHGWQWGPLDLSPVDPALALAWVAGAACAIAAAWQAKFHRLAALILAGGCGLVVCLTFVRMAAPDLALTQLLVEVVTTVLLLLGLRWLPKRVPAARVARGGRAALVRRGRDLAIAVAAGAGLSALSYAVMTRPLPETISSFFMHNAWPKGGGTNVVNVIIVDFRGFDTLGEISVLAVVSLSVYALLRRFRPSRESLVPPSSRRGQGASSLAEDLLVPAVIMRLLFPAILVLVFYLLLRGHNLPGGGFAAGLTLAIAVILQYMAGGTRWAESRLAIRPVRWIGFGLLLAAATGAGALVFAHPFLTSRTVHAALPILGEVHLPSAFFFDLGVFSLVVGATGLILIALAHQSTRSTWS
ncbi:MAG TPA: monovalent cation/H+ antiporter subunit A [Usitatibacter sp.]|nr:monovalent cation/H+ antiporter subunit A [Usitatibacter sp.]